MPASTHYDSDFYHAHMAGSYASAKIVVPIVLGILQVHSVCDVGCGVGTWLRVFRKQGIEDMLGLDGD
jgi:2-polyprenyl-3-methyl-5-hydroxy-6-metoxy-1,4-benzoquinol methylase